MSNNKQSSVEWLMEIDKSRAITIEEWQQAKAMHKEEIMDAYHDGMNLEYHLDMPSPIEYYNETYGGNK